MFRDRKRRVGALDPHFAHRGTSLEWGRVEEEGLRCRYHGWLYDTEGQCTDMPCETEKFRKAIDVWQPESVSSKASTRSTPCATSRQTSAFRPAPGTRSCRRPKPPRCPTEKTSESMPPFFRGSGGGSGWGDPFGGG